MTRPWSFTASITIWSEHGQNAPRPESDLQDGERGYPEETAGSGTAGEDGAG